MRPILAIQVSAEGEKLGEGYYRNGEIRDFSAPLNHFVFQEIDSAIDENDPQPGSVKVFGIRYSWTFDP